VIDGCLSRGRRQESPSFCQRDGHASNDERAMQPPDQSEPLPVEPELPTDTMAASDVEDRQIRRRALLWMFGTCLFEGLGVILFLDDDLLLNVVRIATYLACTALLHQWCGADARLHSRELWPHFALTLVVCPGPLLVLPIHLVRTRGVRGLLSLLLAIGFVVVLVIAEYIGIEIGIFLSGETAEV
jgi:hypothetical protein